MLADRAPVSGWWLVEVTTGAEGARPSYLKKHFFDQDDVSVPSLTRACQPYAVPCTRFERGTLAFATRPLWG